ncbi:MULTISPECIES: D-ornithine 4,5-aminomutase subunit OraE [Vagococcus]|uniref:D-Ornithine 4,5-aminomutase E subunit n=1 Tax=Vagococcus fluvialis bH819 TaxID=1255619 RepID=A0A1X6WQU3_9ENTE|nr:MULTISPECIES: D-ornithine 4,5-aminomutase subunit OraE [Vagococcus]SLM86612.1 D-Ornithine 4,5-aminomutase E subunit [Vagococcus fluvialis bH819]HCM90820.1 LuxR family transcriptional regulator [Vagococcus sp.]
MSETIKLDKNEKLDINEILTDLENYRPKRRGWVWRTPVPNYQLHKFEYKDMAESLKQYVPLPSAKYFGNIDPQGTSSITTEIASGRFEDDIRRMRMAAWHGADHIMVIRTAGQSHFEGLIEGTPQGIGGIPITRKQVRAQRKALDAIEEEVGRPINYHSYVSGIAGPEVAVMFAEEGVNGAHQDPQYNVLYRNINMVRSFIDACESKKVMAWAGIAQIDGAHNANATAREAWKVMPELMVQHALNSVFSYKVGMAKSDICLSTVPPTAPPAPSMFLDLPYAVALREFFSEYRMRAQQNTKYMEASTREATVTHVLNLLISKLTSADIQSTITPDEGRNVPWHIYNVEAVDTAKQVFQGLDGFNEMVQLKEDGPLREQAREIKERSVLFLEGMIEAGGYFQSVEDAFFVDSGNYPERNEDGISRKINGGVGADTVYKRDEDYMAPVTAHFGNNNVAQYDESAVEDPAKLIGGSTFEDPDKIIFIDELDENDNVNLRLEETKEFREEGLIKPEAEWQGDGTVLMTFMIPESSRVAEFAALEMGKKMGLEDCEVINKEVMQAAEGTRIEMKGRMPFSIKKESLIIPEEPIVMSDDEIREEIKRKKMVIVAGTVGEDEHSVGLREIIDIKHGGIERFGVEVHYLGTSVPVEKLVDAAIELNADAMLASTIISHDDIHYKNMQRINDLAIEKGIRDKIMIMAGGTQVIPEIAVKHGMDAAFGRGSNGSNVATALVERRREMEKE